MAIAVPEIDLDKCTRCGCCIPGCPFNAVELVDGRVVIARPQDCNYCMDCETVCPVDAISCPFEIVVVEEST